MAQTMSGHAAAGYKPHKKLSEWPGWDYVPGIAFIVIGVLALMQPPITSLATGIYLGAMLFVGGAFAFAGGLANIGQRGAWLMLLLGVLSFVAGLAVFYNPVAGAVSLVWVLGAWLLGGGIFELSIAFNVPVGRGWLILVGIVDILMGGYVVMMNPAQAFAFLGYFVGVSFVFRGLWSVMFTADLHQAGHALEEAVAA
jgi:uncharacterized membrane protein HdeD (DUF308 family)